MKTIIEEVDLLKKTVIIQWNRKKYLLSFATKLTKKEYKAYYQFYLTRKSTKLMKRSKVTFQQPKILENPN